MRGCYHYSPYYFVSHIYWLLIWWTVYLKLSALPCPARILWISWYTLFDDSAFISFWWIFGVGSCICFWTRSKINSLWDQIQHATHAGTIVRDGSHTVRSKRYARVVHSTFRIILCCIMHKYCQLVCSKHYSSQLSIQVGTQLLQRSDPCNRAINWQHKLLTFSYDGSYQ